MPKVKLTAETNFVVNSDTLAVGDPTNPTPFILGKVRPGEWTAFIETTPDNQYVAFVGASCAEIGDLEAEDTLESIKVSSGLLAICDGRFYKAHTYSDEDLLDTADPFGSFFNGRGIVTESGNGEGEYDILVWRRDGEVISLAVYFEQGRVDVMELPPMEKTLNPAAN